MSYFNPHLPCGRRPISSLLTTIEEGFQSTPSLRKATPEKLSAYGTVIFQSTPSLRKATKTGVRRRKTRNISIHTFLAEGDFHIFRFRNVIVYFNPHLPCGRRHHISRDPRGAGQHFNPHLPCGRRLPPVLSSLHTAYFNPHLPCGRRLAIILTLRLY